MLIRNNKFFDMHGIILFMELMEQNTGVESVVTGSVDSVLVSTNSEETGNHETTRNELFALFAINSPVTPEIDPRTGIKFSKLEYYNEVILQNL